MVSDDLFVIFDVGSNYGGFGYGYLYCLVIVVVFYFKGKNSFFCFFFFDICECELIKVIGLLWGNVYVMFRYCGDLFIIIIVYGLFIYV